MKKLLLLLCVFIFAFVAKASTLSVSVNGNTATITVDGDEYYDLNNASLLGDSESSVRNCENLVFVGKFSSVQGLQGFPNVKSVDYKDAQFQDYSNMTFSYWRSTIETAITSKFCTGRIERDKTFDQNGCPNLVTVEFNGGIVTGICQNAGTSPHLKNLKFNEGVTEITDKAFYNILQTGQCEVTEIVFPKTLKRVGAEAFFQCSNLEDVTMEMLELEPNESCTFGDYAFGSCFNIKHVTLSEGVGEISKGMFDKCGMLESIRIPTTCKTIHEEAFNICGSLHTVIIPEGVELIEKKAFLNSGLTDIYVMATSKEKVPRIYALSSASDSNGTFSSGEVSANTADPSGTHRGDIENATEEEILKWYQNEFSSAGLEVGGGNCLVQLHYPESMRYFYDGVDNPLTDQVETASDWFYKMDPLQDADVTAKTDSMTTWISDAYKAGTNQYPVFGPDKNGRYWPTRVDYPVRILSGKPADVNVPTSLGWRQLPLQKVAGNDDFIFTKKYDNTWYTMCFPWDMDDNTLFRAFNQDCEITEFVGVEVIKTDDESTDDVEYSLVFHFDKVASTYYVTENHRTDSLRYERITGHTENNRETTRTEQVNTDGGTIYKKYYTYQRVEGDTGPEFVYWPFNLPSERKNWSTAQKEMVDRYASIQHLMVYAGHPYMIHPSIGASPGNPADCSFAGVKKLTTDYNQLALDNAVTKIATTDRKAYLSSGGPAGVTPFVNPENGGGGSYTFIGNVGENAKDMLAQSNPAYFLAVTNPTGEGGKADKTDLDQIYPKFYRKTSGGVGKWSQYSAIICPDANALANIEGLDGMPVTQTSGSGAKGFDVVFGEWEVVTPTAIDEIIADAERADQPVKKVNMNVVFNINGEVVREGTPSVEGLPKGLYIVNGKKYMVK